MLEYLTEHPTHYLDEVSDYIFDEFSILLGISTISETLKKLKWSSKTVQKQAAERNEDLRDNWVISLSQWNPEQLVFLDESAASEKTKDRKRGWAPLGRRAVSIRSIKRSERWSVLPAYTIEGYIAWTVVHGSIDSHTYMEFLSTQVLPRCSAFPGPRSVIVQDKAAIHRSAAIRELCDSFDVILAFLPPYSPDYNPIEESFSALKSWMKRNNRLGDEYVLRDDYESFLRPGLEQLAVGGTLGGHRKRFFNSKVMNHISI
jgi:hypothetical protein